ncbi:energy-coupling factor transport system substrate-specific component [Paenibacillus shirakamiensis]|uniref:Energy-coupling factor transport system substrate-specific component n=1 Tax=Paenibacillus shirakamiensis TaxID=1265935 RepID=A0ABS4JJH9_9BACL|nr:ECF-type riboflavin transporter substrate-binding protein [Paenibacillus shirakamiensis]MBP2001843.1 energy-coupling factor transport system substrate-specific component [Paenibacillus shirakamiensis]
MRQSIWKFNTRTVVTIGIGAALYGATSWIGIPLIADTQLRPAIALLAIFGALFGPVVAFLAGIIGHIISDFVQGGIVWWGWALGSGITAAFMGLIFLSKGFNPQEGQVSRKHLLLFTVYGLVGIVVSLTFSGLFDIYVMNEPNDKILAQVALASAANILVFLVLGLPAVWAFAKRNRENTNLSVDR